MVLIIFHTLTECFLSLESLCLASKLLEVCKFPSMENMSVSYMLCPVSLLTLSAISVKRILTTLLGFRYRQVAIRILICIHG